MLWICVSLQATINLFADMRLSPPKTLLQKSYNIRQAHPSTDATPPKSFYRPDLLVKTKLDLTACVFWETFLNSTFNSTF